MTDLTILKGLLYDLQDQVERLTEEIQEIEYNLPEVVAQRAAHKKYREEHPEEFTTFSPDLFSKKLQAQFKKDQEFQNLWSGPYS